MSREMMKKEELAYLQAMAELGLTADQVHEITKAWITATYCKPYNERDFAFAILSKLTQFIEVTNIFTNKE